MEWKAAIWEVEMEEITASDLLLAKLTRTTLISTNCLHSLRVTISWDSFGWRCWDWEHSSGSSLLCSKYN